MSYLPGVHETSDGKVRVHSIDTDHDGFLTLDPDDADDFAKVLQIFANRARMITLGGIMMTKGETRDES